MDIWSKALSLSTGEQRLLQRDCGRRCRRSVRVSTDCCVWVSGLWAVSDITAQFPCQQIWACGCQTTDILRAKTKGPQNTRGTV